MTDLADLFPGFESRWIDTSIGRMFARVGGKGSPLLLMHGYPQTNVMFHRVAPALAAQHTLVIPDLPGYGWSAAPRSGPDHTPYTKRAMAAVMVEIMEAVGFVHFGVVGHDRGGRVAYRLALDHPGRTDKLAVLDVVPTYNMWHGMDDKFAMKVWHWMFLAQAEPFPEMLLGKAPVEYWNWKCASLSKTKDLSCFDPRALAHYHAFIQEPTRIHATCEDYRAGRNADLAYDEADRAKGNKIKCPVLALWGNAGVPSETGGPLATWKEWVDDVRGGPIDSGHYVCEEAPDAVSAALLDFFKA
jgi:haloacetate dehalogenase